MSPIHLDQLAIAAPCTANWDEMTGDDRSRACSLCKKNVYNISAMSRAEAESLIRANEGDICVRLFKRADGTVIVDNCPVGLRAIRKQLSWVGARLVQAMTLFAAVAFIAFSVLATGSAGSMFGGQRLSLKDWLFPPKPETICRRQMMGGLVLIPQSDAVPQNTTAQDE